MLAIRGLTLTSWLILAPFALTSLFLREALAFYFAKNEGVAFPARACVLLHPFVGWWHHRGSNHKQTLGLWPRDYLFVLPLSIFPTTEQFGSRT